MTKEEAKEILTHNWTRVDNPNYSESELDEAFFMAISALSADGSLTVIREQIEKHPYLDKTDTDLISRAEAIEAIKAFIKEEVDLKTDEDDEEYNHDIGYLCGLHRGKLIIKDLPSVSAERVVRCKDCEYRNWETKGCNANPCVEEWQENDFCSRAKMKGGTE